MVDSYHVRIRRVWTRINLYLHIALQVKAMIFREFLSIFNFLLSFFQFPSKFQAGNLLHRIFLFLFWVVLGLVSVLRMNKFMGAVFKVFLNAGNICTFCLLQWLNRTDFSFWFVLPIDMLILGVEAQVAPLEFRIEK